MKKIIVAHPGKQHSFQTAAALKENGTLFKYITTVYDKQGSWLYFCKCLLKGKNLRKANSRRTDSLDDSDVVLFNEIGGLLLILLGKLHLNRVISDYLNLWVYRRFAKKVALYAIKNNVDAVIMYDSNVHQCFDMIKEKAPHIKCILDTTIAARSFMKQIYIKDMEMSGDDGLRKEQSFLWNDKWISRFDKEFADADYFLVGSDFVKRSIAKLVKNETHILTVPYGVNLLQFKNTKRDYSNGPLHLLFVGGVIRRKGIHHLLSVVSKYTKEQIVLHLAGSYNPKDILYIQYRDCSNIIFEGFVTRDRISQIYADCHVFVLPSLAEGMAMVGLEALGAGLPVLCTTNTGLDSVVKDGYNGFVIPPSDEVEMQEKLEWFLRNREDLPIMSEKASESARTYSWEDYKENLRETLYNII